MTISPAAADAHVPLEVPLGAFTVRRRGQGTTVAPRGLRARLSRLIVPPFPAASRPSKIRATLMALLLHQCWSLTSSSCSSPCEPSSVARFQAQSRRSSPSLAASSSRPCPTFLPRRSSLPVARHGPRRRAW